MFLADQTVIETTGSNDFVINKNNCFTQGKIKNQTTSVCINVTFFIVYDRKLAEVQQKKNSKSSTRNINQR